MDEFCGTRFGTSGQLEVIGRYTIDKIKTYYVARCEICQQDSALFGQGVFKIAKSAIKAGGVPCGCAVTPRWTEEQTKLRIQRKVSESEYKFCRYIGTYKGSKTRCILICDQHGEWETSFVNLLSGRGCRLCGVTKTQDALTTPTETYIEEFRATGFYSSGTIFSVVGRKQNRLRWNVFCGDCYREYETYTSAIREGTKRCLCRQASFTDEEHIRDFMSTGVFHRDTSFVREPKPSRRYRVTCGACGETYSSSTTCLKAGHRGCVCSKSIPRSRVPDDEWEHRFRNTGKYPVGTIFKKDITKKDYWEVYCPVCNTKNICHRSNLENGAVPCACGVLRWPRDEKLIIAKMASVFPEGTVFTRREDYDTGGKEGWELYCPVCKTSAKSIRERLMRGQVPCLCSMQRQTQGYCNILYDNDIPVAVKFGIARDANFRRKGQNTKTQLQVKQHSVFRFDSPKSCRAAERECKRTLICGIIPKTDMPDGYTETTYLYNIPAIEAIYRKHGGVRI